MTAIGKRRLLKAQTRIRRAPLTIPLQWWLERLQTARHPFAPMKLGDLGLTFD